MIEKLNAHLYKDTADMFEDFREKINELVDAVNVLQCKNVHIESDLQDLIYPKEIKCEAPDPYAEQRKWIGKLCRFYKNGERVSIDILRAVAEKGAFYPFRSTNEWYEHCEPVSPDDDIIYKKD